jgi:hypothetical protein
MSMTKALAKVVRALQVVDKQNRHRRSHTPARQGGQPPFHWHMVFGRRMYVMSRIGYNQRTHKHVYQCPFCGGKAERPY